MSQQAAAVAAACCCPREQVAPCTPSDTAVVVTMPRIDFDHGCIDYTFQCSTGGPGGGQYLCCCDTGGCNLYGSTCDGPDWDCRSLRVTGDLSGAFVLRMDTDGQYRTRVNCPTGLDETFYGGRVYGEEPVCDRFRKGSPPLSFYRQGIVGWRACVGNITYPVPGSTCDTGCSADQTSSLYAVRAVLYPYAGNTTKDGCAVVIRRLHVGIDVVSQRLAQQWCACHPQFEFRDILSASYSMEYYHYCCPDDPPSGVRGTYEAPQYLLDGASQPVTVECYRSGPLTYIPIKWPRFITIT